MVLLWSLSDSKSPQSSRTQRILATLNSAVAWMISIRVFISKSSSPYTNPLVTVPSAQITIGITVTFMFHSFFSTLAKFRYLSIFLFSINFTLWSARTAKSTIRQILWFLLTATWSGNLAEIRWSVCISKSQMSLCVSSSRTDSRLCIYHLFAWSNFNFLHNSQWITLPTQSCLDLCLFCAN